MKIKLFCNAGMSTSMLVTKMQDAAKKRGLDVEIKAYPEGELANEITDCSIALLGPQIGFQLEKFKKICEPNHVPVGVIPMMDYGMMNGEGALEFALNLKK